MRIRLTGAIVDSEPRLPSRIAGKRLVLDGRGRDRMILDSGFTDRLTRISGNPEFLIIAFGVLGISGGPE